MALREFTVRHRPPDPCPKGCRDWARYILSGGGMEPNVNGHHPRCPLAYPEPEKPGCGYCGSTANRLPDSADRYGGCPDCGGV